ncbi:MAG: HAMP domain-containing histidine kinase, partial [Saprospiraceae bacterium]|nr:HAMP domain-containing histidine kinase [Saprospiraceae bacterium]
MFPVSGFIQHFAGRILVLPSLELTMLLENFQIWIIYLLTALLGVSSLFLFRLFSINSELKTSLYQLNAMQQTKWQNTSLLAHDLRSPLQIIQLKAALLKQNIPDSRHLSDIEYAAERINQMATRIAALQTADKLPGLTLNLPVLHVQEALKTITRPYHDILAGKNIQLSLHLPQTPVYAQIDAPFLSESVE